MRSSTVNHKLRFRITSGSRVFAILPFVLAGLNAMQTADAEPLVVKAVRDVSPVPKEPQFLTHEVIVKLKAPPARYAGCPAFCRAQDARYG